MENTEDEISLTEFGAAENVPGSKLLLKIGRKDYLIDVGKDYQQDGEKESCYKLRDRIIKAGFKPETVHVMKKGQAYTL